MNNESHWVFLNPDPSGGYRGAHHTHRVRLDEGFIPEVIEYRGQRYVIKEWDDDEVVYYLEDRGDVFKPDVDDVEKL